ncbi:NUDIX domain-containing protein [Nocardioidaceae bacterium]|nr:NUDIX domain-containing protein [Nocardioidaceae bacterium]
MLVDPHGRLLLQERDSGAPIAPDCWSLCGGHVEAGEDDETAAHRELAEETGLTDQLLRHWRTVVLEDVDGRDRPSRFSVWVAPTTATDDDIVLGEGRQIVFVDPHEIATLTTSESGGIILEEFLASAERPQLQREAARLPPELPNA